MMMTRTATTSEALRIASISQDSIIQHSMILDLARQHSSSFGSEQASFSTSEMGG